MNIHIKSTAPSCFITHFTQTFLLSIFLCIATICLVSISSCKKDADSPTATNSNIKVTAFVGTFGNGVYVTTNNGANWTFSGLPNQIVKSLAVSGNTVFAGTVNGNGIFAVATNGANWTAVNNGLTGYGTGNSFGVEALAVNGSTVLAGTDNVPSNIGTGVYLTNTNGANWTAVNNGLPSYVSVNSLAVSGSTIFAAIPQGIYISTNNGANWSYSGLSGQNIFGLAASSNKVFAGTASNGLYVTTNNGANWISSGLTSNVYALGVNGSTVFAGITGGVLISTDNGANWSRSLSVTTNLAVAALAVIGSTVFAGTNGGVYVSTNNGENWSSAGLTNQNVWSLAVSKN